MRVNGSFSQQKNSKRGPHQYVQVNSENCHWFFIPRASSCALQNQIFYFCHLDVLVCLTYIKHKFLCLILIFYVLLCLTMVFQHILSLNSYFVLVSGIFVILQSHHPFQFCVFMPKSLQGVNLYASLNKNTFRCLTILQILLFLAPPNTKIAIPVPHQFEFYIQVPH